MSDDARSIVEGRLARVIERHGPQIVNDRGRLTGLLRDAMMNENRPLLSMLLRALDEDVPAALLRSSTDARPYRVVESDLIARVVANTLSDPVAVTWAVQAWARALGVGAAAGVVDEPVLTEKKPELELTERRVPEQQKVPDQAQRDLQQKPPPPWYRSQGAMIVAALIVISLLAYAIDRRPGQSPNSGPSPGVADLSTSVPTDSATRAATVLPTASTDVFQSLATQYTCPMKNPKVSDSFQAHNNAWNPLPKNSEIGQGYFYVRPDRGRVVWAFHDGRLGNGVLCTEVFNTAESSAATHVNSGAGLAFWSATLPGDKNPVVYAFFVSPIGQYGVWRLHKTWQVLLPTVHSYTVRTGGASSNVLTIITQNNNATFYINGDRVGSIHNTQPRGSFGGLISETDGREQAPITWRFGFYASR
jgi:hypothetical protein